MRARRKLNTGNSQFRWVVLLLIVAVILPTVCLLWFMSEVVSNERLVIRQKLVLFHKNELEETARRLEATWSQRCRLFEQDPAAGPYAKLVAIAGQDDYDALLVYDESGQLLYPVLSANTTDMGGSSAVLADAWQLEFVEHDYAEAATRYEQHARSASGYRKRIAALVGQPPPLDDRGLLDALIGQSRSLAKLGQISDALDVCRQAAFSPLTKTGDSEVLSRIADARLLMLTWMQNRAQYADRFKQTFDQLLAMLYTSNEAGAALRTDHSLFVARKTLELAQQNPALEPRTVRAQGAPLPRLVALEARSLDLADRLPTGAAFETWPSDKLQPLPAEPNAYALVHRTQEHRYVAVLSDRSIRAALQEYADAFNNDYVDYRIVDRAGQTVAGTAEPTGDPFAASPVGACFPGWRIDLFFRAGDILDQAASEQIAIYTWTGTLVILLILGSGALAAKSIGRQVKLNRLKNDFIATVTHELKTPLASMRVLVDTLIDGSYHSPQQASEYLHMVAKENERLSRLIDNFLTFSRMERNKQAFQMRRTSPIIIARTAAEAVKTKFDRAGCCLETDIGTDAPDIKADSDAMITVLVNLLDNACKYSYDEKHICLRVYRDDGSACFAVSDNGVGIPRRAAKRIFKRFYQVDRSLSRRAEGCGLGLSIARFIIDAHAGSIKVESTPGQGSTFTIRLPAVP